MRPVATLATVLLAVSLVGCQTEKKGVAPPADAQTLARVRTTYAASDASASVGVVVAIEPKGRPYAAIGSVPSPERFLDGDPVQFIDSRRTPLTNGTVRAVVGNVVHVEWHNPRANGQNPRVGDIAVLRQKVRPAPAPAPPTPDAQPPAPAETPMMPPAPSTEPAPPSGG
jgi:hypothetical protein